MRIKFRCIEDFNEKDRETMIKLGDDVVDRMPYSSEAKTLTRLEAYNCIVMALGYSAEYEARILTGKEIETIKFHNIEYFDEEDRVWIKQIERAVMQNVDTISLLELKAKVDLYNTILDIRGYTKEFQAVIIK